MQPCTFKLSCTKHSLDNEPWIIVLLLQHLIPSLYGTACCRVPESCEQFGLGAEQPS